MTLNNDRHRHDADRGPGGSSRPPDPAHIAPFGRGPLPPHHYAPGPLGGKGPNPGGPGLLQDKTLGVVASREDKPTGFGPDNLFPVGTAATILKMRKPEDGSVRLLIQGLYRFRIENWMGQDPYLVAQITPIAEEYEPDLETEALVSNVKGLFLKMLELSPYLPSELGSLVRELGDPRVLADITAGSLNISKEEKQELLETFDVKERLHQVLSLINRELEVLELGKKIQSQVKGEVDKAQRDYYLREHIKALQKELGEADEPLREMEEIQFRLEEAELPPHAKKEAERELNRLKRTPPTSPDHQVIRNYLEWMAELPWSTATEDNLDLAQARQILDEDHYDLEKVKKRILEYLAVRKLKPDMKSPILCFVGPPGTGKTSLGRSIARALGRKFVRLSLGGVRDEAEIRGHRRTYVGALPGRIIQSIRRAGSNNPVFILDEVDKIGADFRGDPSSALLEVLDPEQNNSFSDHYLDVGFDLSKVMFITTANLLDPIPPPLRDRMEVLELPGYTEEEKLGIAFSYLLPRQLEAHGLNAEQLEITPEAMRRLIADYTREAGLRNLEREIAGLCRGVAREVVEGNQTQVVVKPEDLAQYLGPPRFFRDAALDHPEPGVAVGLAWTPTGGDILFIEVLRMPGKGRFQLTGQLGEVMKESANAALSYIRARAPFLGIEEDFFDERGPPYPRARGGHPQRRPLRGPGPARGPGVPAFRPPCEKRPGHDRGDHPPGPRAARGRHQEQGPGRTPGRHPGSHPPRQERSGPGRNPRVRAPGTHFFPGGGHGPGPENRLLPVGEGERRIRVGGGGG